MKKIFLIFVAFVLPKAALAWIPQMQFQVLPNYAQVQVVNPTPFNAFCQGYLTGVTQTGYPVNAWFSNVVPAYGYQYVYVYAYAPYYLVNAWSNIQCQ